MEFYFASDASAMVEHTKRVLHLEDDDVAHIHNGGYGIYRMEKIHTEGEDSPSLAYAPTVKSAEVERTIETLTMEVEQIMKGNFDHFMKKEIHEQPDAIQQTMRGRVEVARRRARLELRALPRRVRVGLDLHHGLLQPHRHAKTHGRGHRHPAVRPRGRALEPVKSQKRGKILWTTVIC